MATSYQTARHYALSLPETTEAPHHHFGSFRVAGKIFVTIPPEATHLHLFVSETDREQALVLYPGFIEKLYWGDKVCGLRLLLAAAPAKAVNALILQAWRHKASKTLLKQHPTLQAGA
ncbi:MmcQ/YjbR family DNA-binding protein [Ahniella affigens]|nr:MmcQ/YjbR family DNA-binding protein [Ahniella affigens]